MSPAAAALAVYGTGAALLIAVIVAILWQLGGDDPAPLFSTDAEATEILPIVPQSADPVIPAPDTAQKLLRARADIAADWHDKLDDLIAEWIGTGCCVRCQRVNPGDPCQGCYCHDPVPAPRVQLQAERDATDRLLRRARLLLESAS